METIKAEDYLSKYSKRQRKIKSLSQAAQIALDTRKFEIDLYWKRATYFWAFIAADIAAFALIFARMGTEVEKYVLMTVFSFLGVLFSLGWYFVNRGSKYWQENWEDHIGILITKEAGPIFKYRKSPKHKLRKLNGYYPFSVSKVNQFLSGVTTIAWFVLFEISLHKLLKKEIFETGWIWFWMLSVTLILFVILIGMVFFLS